MSIEEIKKNLISVFDIFDDDRWEKYQKPIMSKILEENSRVLGILPTGTGKSVLYQYFGWFNSDDGIIIVIEPLQSIIQDQINSFQKVSFDHSLGTCAGTIEELLSDNSSDISIVFTSPEQLFKYSNRIFDTFTIQMIVIDELHTMFEWGTAFRSAFLFIPSFINRIITINQNSESGLRVLALTATINNAEIDLCKEYLKITTSGVIGDYPVLNDDRREYTSLERIDDIDNAFDYLKEIIKDDSKRYEGIAFFKEYETISKFTRYFLKECTKDNIFKYDKEQSNPARHRRKFKTSYMDRLLLEFKGDLNIDDKKLLLDSISHKNSDDRGSGDYKVFVVATKALAMGVDLQSINNVVIVGIPESWNCFLQEIGRLRKPNYQCTVKIYYSSSDAINMLNKLIKNNQNPICVSNQVMNIMERIMTWDYLCLWEWMAASFKESITEYPKGLSLSLDDLLSKTSEDIRNKLKIIVALDDQIDEKKIDYHGFDPVFDHIPEKEHEISPLLILNTSKVFISFEEKYSGLFNGGVGKFKRNHFSIVLKTDVGLNFFDYLIYCAVYSHHIYSEEKLDAMRVIEILLGRGIEDENLIKHVKESLKKVKNTSIHVYRKYKRKSEEKPYLLFDEKDGSFPLLDRFPYLQDNVAIVETTVARNVFNSIKGKRGKNLTAVNIIAAYYTLFGIERHKQIVNSINGKGINWKWYRLKIPYSQPVVDNALTEWFYVQKEIEKKNIGPQNKRQEYAALKTKMKKALVLYNYPEYSDNEPEKIDDIYKTNIIKAYGIYNLEKQIQKVKKNESELADLQKKLEIQTQVMENDMKDNLISCIKKRNPNRENK